MKKSTRDTLVKIHKWLGLTAGLWLFVLGATGVLLDRHESRFLNQTTVPIDVLSDPVKRLVPVSVMRQLIGDADNPNRMVGASWRGMWRTEDGGDSWVAVAFAGYRGGTPQVYSLLADPAGGIDRSWIATDDGLWQLQQGQAVRVAFAGKSLQSLSQLANTSVLIGVIERTNLFTLDSAQAEFSPRSLTIADVDAMSRDSIGLGRYLLGIHVGAGLLPEPWGIYLNDLGGIAFMVLAITGFLYWFFPRYWKKRRGTGGLFSKHKGTTLRVIYRSHAPILGIMAALPIFYLSATALFANHATELFQPVSKIDVPSALIPPGFSQFGLAGEIQQVVGDPVNAERIYVATRAGIYSSDNLGKSWQVMTDQPINTFEIGGLSTFFRVDGALFLGVTVGKNFVKLPNEESWRPLVGPFTSVSSGFSSADAYYLRNSQGVFVGNPAVELVKSAIKSPQLEGAPLFLLLTDIHIGFIISTQFKWVNDFVALLALGLVLSGLFMWWSKKWI